MTTGRLDVQAFQEWLRHGVDNGYVTPTFCYTHEGDPYMTDEEIKEYDEGYDTCMVIMKVKAELPWF